MQNFFLDKLPHTPSNEHETKEFFDGSTQAPQEEEVSIQF